MRVAAPVVLNPAIHDNRSGKRRTPYCLSRSVEMLEGRTTAQKEALAQAITDALGAGERVSVSDLVQTAKTYAEFLLRGVAST